MGLATGARFAASAGMRLQSLGVSVALMLAFLPSPAMAQREFLKDNLTKIIRKTGVHVNTSWRKPLDSDVTKGTTFSGSIGLSPGRTNGWRYPFGFTTFSENLHGPNGEEFAKFKSRAILGGIGYGWHFGKLSVGTSVQAGWGFNHGTLAGNTARVFGSPEGPTSIHISNSPILRPQFKVEYFLTPKFTVRSSADYMFLRPAVDVTTVSGPQEDRWRASNFHANVGIGFYPFRK
jgi:hypothetical protein